MRINLKKGLDIPIAGAPEQAIENAHPPSRVALIAHEYHGLKPGMHVSEGDEVATGQALFVDRRYPQVRYVSPASGTVEAINRGEKRVLQSVVIRVEGERSEQFECWKPHDIATRARAEIVAQLLRGGLWAAIRTRPYSKTPDPESTPHSIFINATDTRPLAPDPETIIADSPDMFTIGMRIVRRLTEGKVFVCTGVSARLPLAQGDFEVVEFAGPHPAGLTGTHIHFLDPVGNGKVVWGIGYQDVIAFGELFVTGVYPTERVVSLAGPTVKRPRLLRTRIGASVSELCAGEIEDDESRLIAGSVLDGYKADGWSNFLGRFTLQVTALRERGERRVLGWLRPGFDLFSASRAVFSNLVGRSSFAMNCAQNGSPRALVPITLYERVMPLDLLPTSLLKSLLVMDTDMAQKLGCLELDDEDLALCSYVCPGKHEFGPILRANLDLIEKEG